MQSVLTNSQPKKNAMNPIEFTVIAHDGMIDLPEPYRTAWNRKTIRVICAADMADTETDTLENDPAFGLWQHSGSSADGLEYQQRLRSEWPV